MFLFKSSIKMKDLEFSSRCNSKGANLLDHASHFLMDPWLSVFSHLLSCYISTVQDELCPHYKLIDYYFLGPLYIVILVVLSPVGLFGSTLWILLCTFFPQKKYIQAVVQSSRRHCVGRKDSILCKTNSFSFATANVLLAPEFVGRLNNVKETNKRGQEIAKRIAIHSGKQLFNVKIYNRTYEIAGRSNSILSEFPYVDFLCLQEVWEQSSALLLIRQLKKKFDYFLYDVGEHSLKINMCMIGSGLMFASKRPILEADFKAFTYRTKHAKYTAQGVLCVKVLLYYNGPFRHVGFVSNVHTQAFQEYDAVIPSQLTEVNAFLHMFKERCIQNCDIVDFDVICGDFNADNMSPADRDVQYHEIFNEYKDICVVRPGVDKNWAIGTELRQRMLYKPPLQNPKTFKEVLIDDSLRRLYVLDADVLVHGRNLVNQLVTPDEDGNIPHVQYGGMRRIDRIIFSKAYQVEVVGYCFSTALTNLTDHLPVCLQLKTISE
ncbi:sphingomyelin phosphodiesterase 5 isoform X2 [Anabrus simplex]|uniref:sphingomyelin phosphodiesterase 5 isoform X2 n=1 Tax=Anabrus simplex TaxID=316456 RepID=UPI0035A31FEE